MVYQKKRVTDARSAIRSNDDARLHLNKTAVGINKTKKMPVDMRSQLKRKNTNNNSDNKIVFDARQTISNISKQAVQSATSTKQSRSEPVKPKFTQKAMNTNNNTPIGFISVTNGSRKLQEKVTMDSTGMKIAVRNDIVVLEEHNTRSSPDTKSNDSKYHLVRTVPGSISTSRSQRNSRRDHVTSSHMTSSSHNRSRDNKPYSHHHHHHERSSKAAVKMQQSRKSTPPPPIKVETPPHKSTHHEEPPSCSPFQGTKILVSNLHPIVVEDDIMELFCAQGPVRRARLTSPGKAEVVFIRREDAITAYEKYNNRDLDGQPMQMTLLLPEGPLPPTPIYTWMEALRPSRQNRSLQTLELHLSTLERALFKGGRTGTSSRPVVFTVKI